jgi:AcrR family transcriptional regulator
MQERIPQAGSPCIRQRIVQAAIRLHRQIGFKKTTVADIARGASMSPANVYRFFASKQAIEEAVVADLFEHGLRGRNACGSLERLGSGASNGRFERNLAAARTSAGERQQTTRIGRCGGKRELASRAVLRRPDPGACAHDHCWRTGERRTATGKSDGDDVLPA